MTTSEHPTPDPSALPTAGLGPLVRIGGQWLIGDHERTAHIALLPEGLEHRVAGRDPVLVPWPRLMSLGIGVSSGRFLSTPAGGLLSKYDDITVHGSCLNAMVRNPYDMWKPRFFHHRQRYPAVEILIVRQLLEETVRLGRADLLGDDAWLTSALRDLAPARLPWTRKGQLSQQERVAALVSDAR
ncbi:hypothetical protein GCM10018781_64270 [Kitasatospora indigofera]|uniref:Uncharacterized protein n=2 Tax=Kitasatospora indigofera TaxID=67307 RepID=A0A919GB16_9ACTN|nr:hypothetical protein GCM10018781_64270 [Kitasatospora indigofera]